MNDARSQAFAIYDAGYIPANNSGAGTELGEPTHGGVGTGHSLWWRWQGGAGEHTLTLRPYRPGLSFVLVTYSVDSEGQLTEQAKVQAQDMTPESVHFVAESGVDYLFAVDSTSAGTGWFYFSIDQAPEIHAPLSVTYKQGESITIPVQIAGFPDLVEITEGDEFFSYDPIAKAIIGAVPTTYEEASMRVSAYNDFGSHEVSISAFQSESDYALTSPASALGLVGVPFEYALEFANSPAFIPDYFDSASLPQGFALIREQGQWTIKGTPQEPDSFAAFLQYYVPAEGMKHAFMQFEFIDYTEAHLVPEITSPLMAHATIGVPFRYQVETSLPVNEFDAQGLPEGLTIDQGTGLISGIPENDSPSEMYVTLSYDYGQTVEGRLKLEFNQDAPIEFLVPPVLHAYVDVPFKYVIATSSPAEAFSAGSLPPGLELDWDTGVISGIPTQPGEFGSDVWVQSPTGGEAPEMFLTIQVLDSEPLMHLTSPAQASGTRGEYFEYQLETAPLDPYAPGVDVSSLPSGLNYDGTTRRIVGVPQNDGLQTASFYLEGNEFNLQFRIGNSFAPPEFLSPASAAAKTNNFFFFAFSAPNADYFQIVGDSLPDGLFFNTTTGVISGIPLIEGDFSTVVRAHNSGNHSDTVFTVSVRNELGGDERMILSPGQMIGSVGETIVYQISFSNASSTYNVVGLPTGFRFDASSGIIYGSSANPINKYIRIENGFAKADILLNVYPPEPDATPLLVVSPPSALGEPGEWFEFQIETNASAIGMEIFEFIPDSSWPDGLTLDQNTGRISGYLGEDWPQELGFNIYADGGQTESFLRIIDGSAGRPPQIESLGHVLAYEGEFVEYFFEFRDANVDLGIQGLPPEFAYDPIQRKLYGHAIRENRFTVAFEAKDADDPSLFTNGKISLQVLPDQLRPRSIVTSQMLPVAERGEYFSYRFAFDQGDAAISWLDSGENWLRQTGPNEISGIVPEDGFVRSLQVFFEYEIPNVWNSNGQLTIEISDPIKPTVVTSPATAMAYVGLPFEYELTVDPLRQGDTVILQDAPAWLSFDTTSRMLSGTPESPGVDTVDITIATASGAYDSRILIRTSHILPRPVIYANSPPPGFLNVPYLLPFSIDGVYDDFNYFFEETFSINSSHTALIGLPDMDQGGYSTDLNVANPYSSSNVRIDIGFFESAPVIIEDPQSMVTFLGGEAYFSTQFGGAVYTNDWLKDGLVYSAGRYDLTFWGAALSDQGDYSFHIANSIGEALSHPARLAVGTPRKLRDWTIAHVGESIDQQPGGEPEESWANDGVSNLMKWAMGLPLEIKVNEPLIGGDYIEGALQLEFVRNTNAEDVTLLVERSETLAADSWQPVARRLAGGSWQSLRASTAITESGTDSARTVTVRDRTIGDRGFLRVSVLLETD